MLDANTILRMTFNAIVFMAYVRILMDPESAPVGLMIPLFAWGVWAFRKLIPKLSLQFAVVDVSFLQYLSIWIIGSLTMAIFGFLIIPIFLFLDFRKMIKP